MCGTWWVAVGRGPAGLKLGSSFRLCQLLAVACTRTWESKDASGSLCVCCQLCKEATHIAITMVLPPRHYLLLLAKC